MIALYLEDFRDGRAFVAAAARARAAGTPIVLLPGGTTGSSARAAQSHTGALVATRGDRRGVRGAGDVRVGRRRHLIDAAQPARPSSSPGPCRRLCRRWRTRSRRDRRPRLGGPRGPVPVQIQTDALGGLLPATASLANPVDFAGGGERGLTAYAEVGRVLLGSGDVDAVLPGYFGGSATTRRSWLTKRLRPRGASLPRPAEADGVLIVQTSSLESAAARELRRGGVPVYGDVASAAGVLALLAQLGEREPTAPLEASIPELERPEPGYAAARAFLAEAGVPMSASARRSRSTRWSPRQPRSDTRSRSKPRIACTSQREAA